MTSLPSGGFDDLLIIVTNHFWFYVVGATLVFFIVHVMCHKWEYFCDCRRLESIQNKEVNGCFGVNRIRDESKKRSTVRLANHIQQNSQAATSDLSSTSPVKRIDVSQILRKKIRSEPQEFFVPNNSGAEEVIIDGNTSSFSSTASDSSLPSSKRGNTVGDKQEMLQKRRELALEIEQARRGLEECSKFNPTSTAPNDGADEISSSSQPST